MPSAWVPGAVIEVDGEEAIVIRAPHEADKDCFVVYKDTAIFGRKPYRIWPWQQVKEVQST